MKPNQAPLRPRDMVEQAEAAHLRELDRPKEVRKRRTAPHPSHYWPPTREVNDLLSGVLRWGPGRVDCVWSGQAIRDRDEIGLMMGLDSGGQPHLWNIVPVKPAMRLYQGDALPSGSLLERSRARILAWWRRAYWAPPFHDRFFEEAEGCLIPSRTSDQPRVPDWDRVFEGLVEWNLNCLALQRDGSVGWNPYGEREQPDAHELSPRQQRRWPWRYDRVAFEDGPGGGGDGW